jgi:RNA polymerase sigma-70 factor (ECF subfamily)
VDETRVSLLYRLRDPGDQAAWAEFVARYEPLLFSYVRKKGVSPSDEGDVVQHVLMNVLRAMRTFELDKAQGRFRTWLYRVTVNAVNDLGRRRKRLARERNVNKEEVPEPVVPPAEPEPDWEGALQERALQLALGRVKARSEEKTWASFEQHFLKGRPGEEVAAELGLKANTVYVHTSRILERLRLEAEKCRQELEEGDHELSH